MVSSLTETHIYHRSVVLPVRRSSLSTSVPPNCCRFWTLDPEHSGLRLYQVSCSVFLCLKWGPETSRPSPTCLYSPENDKLWESRHRMRVAAQPWDPEWEVDQYCWLCYCIDFHVSYTTQDSILSQPGCNYTSNHKTLDYDPHRTCWQLKNKKMARATVVLTFNPSTQDAETGWPLLM